MIRRDKTKFILTLLLVVVAITALNVPYSRPSDHEEQEEVDTLNEAPTVVRENVISPYDSIMRRVALDYGYDWRFISAVAHTESKFNETAASGAGAKGLMQITPIVAERYGVSIRCGIRRLTSSSECVFWRIMAIVSTSPRVLTPATASALFWQVTTAV